MTITNSTKAHLQLLAAQLSNLKVEERQALEQMLPERKVFRASEEERAHQDLVIANLQDKAVQERRAQGIARNMTTLNTNQTKNTQQIKGLLDSLGGDHEVLHGMLTKLITILELDKQEKDQWRGAVMETLLELQDKLNKLTGS